MAAVRDIVRSFDPKSFLMTWGEGESSGEQSPQPSTVDGTAEPDLETLALLAEYVQFMNTFGQNEPERSGDPYKYFMEALQETQQPFSNYSLNAPGYQHSASVSNTHLCRSKPLSYSEAVLFLRHDPSPLAPPMSTSCPPPEPGAVTEGNAEDKRRRNNAACARLWIKKKQRVQNLEKSVSDLTNRVEELEEAAADLRRENGWLKEIVVMKALAEQPERGW